MKLKPCIACGNQVNVQPVDAYAWIAVCTTCGCSTWMARSPQEARDEYEAFRAAIVSRALAEAVKDAQKVEARADGSTDFGDIAPGTYALIPVKEDKP